MSRQAHAGPRVGTGLVRIDARAIRSTSRSMRRRRSSRAIPSPCDPPRGLGAGEEANVTVAAVDVGILNLTHYQCRIQSFFFGQRQLSSEIRDLYVC